MENFQPDNPTTSSPIRILVADGERSEHLLLTMAAEEAHRHVHFDFVCTGNELLQSLTNDDFPNPNLLLLDSWLPRVDAQSVLITLGLERRLDNLPVVVLADDPTSPRAQAHYAFGAFLVAQKPQTFGDMVELIDDLTDPQASTPLRAFDRRALDDLTIDIAELDG